MERKDFINLAFLLPAIGPLKALFTEEVLFHFDESSLGPAIKLASAAERASALMMMKNLLFNVKHVIGNAKDFKNAAEIKNLAVEADKKFYEANRLSAKSFGFQPLTIPALKGSKSEISSKIKEIDALIENLQKQIKKLNDMQEKIESLLPRLMNALAEDNGQRSQECVRTMSMVACIAACVVAIVVAVVVAVFSFDAGSTTGSQAVTNAMAIISATSASVLSATPSPGLVLNLSNTEFSINKKVITLEKAKIDFRQIDLETILKCSITSAAIASAKSAIGDTSYPANPLASSIVVSLFGITGKMAGIETFCGNA